MRRWHILPGVCLALWLARSAEAQVQVQPQPIATTVQLPSFSFFSVATTVSVPVSARGYGRVYAGGNNFAASGRNRFGPPLLPGQVALGREHRASGVTVSAQIHDLHGPDRQRDDWLLRPEVRAARLKKRLTLADRIARNQAADSDRPIQSVAAIRQQKKAKTAALQREALALMERARKAVAEDKPGVARIYYRMAAQRAEGEFKSRILSLLEGLNTDRN